MKKIIYNILILLFVAFAQSCTNEEKDLFGQSSAERINAALISYQEILVAAPNGWLMEYYAGIDDQKIGGYNYICSFDAKGSTVMAGEVETESYGIGDKVTSMYRLIADQSVVLTFDTYNEIFHTFSEPKGGTAIYGYQGDYEFVIMDISPEKITLKGKRFGNKIIMTPLAAGVDWKTYLEEVNGLLKASAFPYYQLSVNGQEKDLLAFTMFRRSFDSDNIHGNAVFRKEGIQLYEPIRIEGKTAENFTWDTNAKAFICTDNGAADIKLTGYIPDDYVAYESYIGKYTFLHWGNITKTVTISKLQDKSTFLLSSDAFGFPIVMEYDFSTGYIYLKTQKVGEYNGYDVLLCAWDPLNGYLAFGSNTGMRGKMKDNRFILEDYGSFSGYVVDGYILWLLSGSGSVGSYPLNPYRFPFSLTFTKQ